MIIKLNKSEVEAACEQWLRGGNYPSDKRRTTTTLTPFAIDSTMQITCTHTSIGVECIVEQKP